MHHLLNLFMGPLAALAASGRCCWQWVLLAIWYMLLRLLSLARSISTKYWRMFKNKLKPGQERNLWANPLGCLKDPLLAHRSERYAGLLKR